MASKTYLTVRPTRSSLKITTSVVWMLFILVLQFGIPGTVVAVAPACSNAEDGTSFPGSIAARVGMTGSVAVGDLNSDAALELVTTGAVDFGDGIVAPYIDVWTRSCPTVQKLWTVSFGRAVAGSLNAVSIGNFYPGDSQLEVVAVGTYASGEGMIAAVQYTSPIRRVVTPYNAPGTPTKTVLTSIVEGDVDRDGKTEFIFTGWATYSTFPTRRTVLAYAELSETLQPIVQAQLAMTEIGDGTSRENQGVAVGHYDFEVFGVPAGLVYVTGHYTQGYPFDPSPGHQRSFLREFDVLRGDGNPFDCHDEGGCVGVWSYRGDPTWETMPTGLWAGAWRDALNDVWGVVVVGYGAAFGKLVPEYSAVRIFSRSPFWLYAEYDASNAYRSFNDIDVRDSDGNSVWDEIVAVGTSRSSADKFDDDAGYITLAWSPDPNPPQPLLKTTNTWSGSGSEEGAYGIRVVQIAGWQRQDFIVSADLYRVSDNKYTGQIGIFVDP